MIRQSRAATREARREELLHRWGQRERNRVGQNEVLSLCFSYLPPGTILKAPQSVIDIILDHEFGPESTNDVSDDKPE